MYLKSITVKNFRKFKDFSINFPSDITVIKGPNEKGKSTILSAILAGFFYDPKKSNREIDALKSWHSDQLYEMRLEIENNGNEIVLEKNFNEKEMLLENKTTGEKIKNFKDISDYLYKIGSLRSLSLFENTACVKHDALSLITQGKREISQALQSLLTSSSENVSPDKIIKKINDLLTEIQKGLKQPSKTPGVLKEIESNILELEDKKSKLKAELDDVSKKSDYLGSIQTEYNNLKEKFDIKFRQYEMNKKYFQTIKELESLSSQFKKIESDIEVLEELEKNKEYILFQLKKMSFLEGFDIREFYKKVNNLKDKEAKLQYLKKYYKNTKETESKKGKNSFFLMGLFVAFFIVGFLGFLEPWLFSSFAISILFFILNFVFKKKNSESKKIKTVKDIKILEKEIDFLSDEINLVFEKSHIKNDKELIDKIKEYNEFCKELEKTESKEEGILRGFSFSDVKKEKSSILKNIGILEEKISEEQKVNVPTPQEQRLLEVDLEKYDKKLDDLKKEILQVSAVSNQYAIDKENIIKLEEDLEFEKEKKLNFEKKVKILESLAENLKEAQSRILSKSKSHIEDYMKKYLITITDGRYDNMKVNDDLSFNVWSEEKKDMVVPEDHLSQGTVDQFYLVARFAILDVLNKGNKSLVLLDDPFHSFDSKRREKTKQVLNDLTDRFQIVLFSHSSDYDDWGEVVEI